jgi:hypothetical protein
MFHKETEVKGAGQDPTPPILNIIVPSASSCYERTGFVCYLKTT